MGKLAVARMAGVLRGFDRPLAGDTSGGRQRLGVALPRSIRQIIPNSGYLHGLDTTPFRRGRRLNFATLNSEWRAGVRCVQPVARAWTGILSRALAPARQPANPAAET